MGEVYFRVSKHLGCKPSEVMLHKFEFDYKFLIMKYTEQIKREIKEAEEINEKLGD